MGRNQAPSPLRLALVAALLFVAVAGTQAQCTVGSIKLDLVETNCVSNTQALCLPSFRVRINDIVCSLQIESLLAPTDRVYVPAIWDGPGTAHDRFQLCPTTASTPTPFTGGSDQPTVEAEIESAMEQRVYNSPEQARSLTLNWATSGVLTVTEGGCTFKYAITEVVDSPTYPGSTWARATCGGGLSGAECVPNLLNPCGTGRRPVSLAAGMACAYCRAGTYSDSGTQCSECTQGKLQGAVGAVAASACTNCAAGTSAAGGNSLCLPCDAGTYQQDSGQGSCDPCPANSYARWPGMTMCMMCENGIGKCAHGKDGATTCSGSFTPSAGYHVLSVATVGSLKTCSLASGVTAPPLFTTCNMDSTTLISVYVSAQCVVTLSPIGDTTCSELSDTSPTYKSLQITNAFYVAPGKIATRLISSNSVSAMLTLDASAGDILNLQYWGVTTDVTKAADIALGSICSGTVQVTGGQVALAPNAPLTVCPAGTYNPASDEYCLPCPVGHLCPAGATTATPCAAGTSNPYLGQSETSACVACDLVTFTSTAGSETCSVPYYNENCSDGFEYNSSTGACEVCPAGTQRGSGDGACTPCAAGMYSAAGQATCTDCPQGQHSPDSGLAEQTSGTQKCLSCLLGYIAIIEFGTTPATAKATECLPCGPGTVATLAGSPAFYSCTACPAGTFRSGDASPNNNVCNKIPAGYKEKTGVGVVVRAEIERCGTGQVSFWDETHAVRTPSTPTDCDPCTGNAYAPRLGMSACRPCPAGTKVNALATGCDSCGLVLSPPVTGVAISYRPFTSTSSTCLQCGPGKEVAGNNWAACTPCIAGYYMPAQAGNAAWASASACLACPRNQYQPSAGQVSCLKCPAGQSTQDTGNVECTDCPLGYYSPKPESLCVATPRGTYVNTTGATIFQMCPQGTFSTEVGADSCEACGPGEYSSTQGSRSCKTCPAGTFSKAKSTSCTRCQTGYTSVTGSSFCTPCKAGTFSSVTGAATCFLCPRGKQCPTVAMSASQDCRLGYYSNRVGQRLCTPCPPNTITTATGATSCIKCGNGLTTRGLSGQSLCQPIRPQNRRRLLGGST